MILVSSDSFPILSIGTAGHELANMKHFAKIDLKSAYNHIEIDDRFKEIIILNPTMGLWRWSCRLLQRAIEKILLGKVDNIFIYQDDICLAAREELKSKIE